MGKPSSTHLSKDNSNSKHKMNAQKLSIKKKKFKRKALTSVIKVFNQLKDENISRNNSISSISSGNITVIDLEATVNSPVRSNLNINQQNNNLIVICDDDELITNTMPCGTNHSQIKSPIHCSTPIRKTSSMILKESLGNNQNNNNCSTIQNLNDQIVNLTKEINRDSYVTIDLTEDSNIHTSCSENNDNTVIDLVNMSEGKDLMLTSVSNTSLSMSGDSDVTVLNVGHGKNEPSKQMRKFVKGISKLDSKEKGKLLKLITETVFTGCNINNNRSKISLEVKPQNNIATETVEDTYIKEVILGQVNSRNSIGSNIYNPERDIKNRTGLRMVVIDGSNVAMQHTMGREFSVKGLKICIDYFLRRGHVVKAFVPRFRCKFGKSTEPRLLDRLERQGLVVYTPSREIQGKMVTSYDDRYIVQCAAEFDGVIVSGDNYRDLLLENPRWRFVIENRLLQFTWVGDMIMFPKDPLGRSGPTLDQFLRHT